MIVRRLAFALAAIVGTLAPVLVSAPTPAGAASSCNASAFVANEGDGNVSVLDLATDTVVGGPIGLGGGPSGVAISPDGARVYVTDGGGTTMKVLDATTRSNSSASPGTVSVIDVATRTVVGTITVGSSPEGIAATRCTTPLTPLEPVAPAPAALTVAPRFTG